MKNYKLIFYNFNKNSRFSLIFFYSNNLKKELLISLDLHILKFSLQFNET